MNVDFHFGYAASGGASAPEPPRATGVGPLSHGFYSLSLAAMFEIGVFSPIFFTFFEIGLQLCSIPDFSRKNTQETSDYRSSQKTDQKSGLKIRRDSGPTAVARGGCGATAPPLAARPYLKIGFLEYLRISDEIRSPNGPIGY